MNRAGAWLSALLLAGALVSAASTAAAQAGVPPGPAQPLDGPRGARRDTTPPRPVGGASTAAAPAQRGPRVALSYRLYALRDDLGGSLVHTGGFAGFLPTRFVRAGAGVEAGMRSHTLDERQGVVSGHVFVGYQHLRGLGPVVPYACALGELGVVLQKRFHTPQSEGYRGAGLELGADVKLVRSLYMGVGVSFMLYTMDGLAYDTFGLRLSVGL